MEDAVLAAYRAYWDAIEEAAIAGDAEPLEAVALRDEFRRLRSMLMRDVEAGVVRRGELLLKPKILEQGESVAIVSDCYIDSAGIYVRETDQIVVAPEPEAVQARFLLRKTSRGWLVAKRTEEAPTCSA